MNKNSPSLKPSSELQFRAIEDSDKEFLCALYGSTRAEELAQVPWTDEQKNEFIEMQFNAQHTFYQEQFKDAKFDIVLRNDTEIGRLYLDHREAEIRIIDIALLPEHRGKGLGLQLLNGVIAQARAGGSPITIHVEKNNPAMRLYKRLGFEIVEDQGVYDLMRWQA